MAESTAPPPKSGGSGPIIIAAVLMLLVIGGLIVWKVTSGSEPEKVEAPPVATTVAPVVADEPPPPPPPEPEPEPSAKPDEKKVVKGGSGPNPCAKECVGSAPANLQSALGGRGAQARSCYEKALSANPTLQGTMLVSVKVGPSGQVCSASVGNDTLGDVGVKNCVANHFRSSTLPAPQGGCVDVNVPLRFMPKK